MYKIVGADQKEYGPVSAEQIQEWIAQGRANGQTVARLEDGPWKPLSTFPEFKALFAAAAPPPVGVTPAFSQPGMAKSNGMAVTGLIFGILSLFCCGVVGAILGLIFSFIGLSQITQNPQNYTTGKGVPIAGIVLSLVGLAVFVVLLMTGSLAHLLKVFRKF